ncbi:hypothetical protein [Halospeciosus flavus]|uniref:Uncharacterized protein n=1 Tax=Halospeciosus flavus TaxID=3032283 RepID=A0ABD5Z007_9EURY
MFVLLSGVSIAGIGILAKRYEKLTAKTALSVIFTGIVVGVIGAVLFDALSPDPTYLATSMPFSRAWYPLIGVTAGLTVVVASFFIGWIRWPTRPRYMVIGMLSGGWILYPYIVPGFASKNPLGYALVLGTPLFIGYVLWTDTRHVFRTVLRDPIPRRFGAGIATVTGFFFLSITGYLSFFPDEDVPAGTVVTVLPAKYQLVVWPTLEILVPKVPFFLALSVGEIAIVGTLSVLVGLQASLIARKWLVDEGAGFMKNTANTSAIVGSCTCGCCGPLVAKVLILAAGPSVAAPLYWVFVDTASPLSVVFIVGSMLLFTGSILHSVAEVGRSDRSTAIASAQTN